MGVLRYGRYPERVLGFQIEMEKKNIGRQREMERERKIGEKAKHETLGGEGELAQNCDV